jgi:ubiquinone/menaquinone biosynthesis C-methylase UbiE
MKKSSFQIPHTCPWWFISFFDNPLRKKIHDPEKIVAGLVDAGDTVLDVGCGIGYFTIALARLVGNSGHVIAADLQARMLDGLRKRAQRENVLSQIRLHQCTPDQIGLTEPIDFALAFWMVHEVRDPERFLNEILAALKYNGKLMIVEPKIHVPAQAFNQTVRLAEELGFKVTGKPQIRWSMAVILAKRTASG